MLSGVIKSNYLQYKEDTKAIAVWLATTARSRNYPEDDLISKVEKQPSGRLKGKARQAARGREKTTDTTKGASSRKVSRYKIRMNDFAKLAEWIAGQTKPKIPVPTSVLNILHRAILARRSFGKHVMKKDRQSETNHQHFVDVLEHVRSVLAPRSLAKDKVTRQKDQSKEETLANQFDVLNIEEPSQAFLDAPDVLHGVKADYGMDCEADCDIEIETLEEVLFALKLIQDDCDNFRGIISESWLGYSDHKYDLIPVSIMTNTAIDLVRGFEEDAEPLFSKHGGSEQVLQHLLQAEHDTSRGDLLNMNHLDHTIKSIMYDAPDGFFWYPYLILHQFLLAGDTLSVLAEDDDELWQYDSGAERSTMTAPEKFGEDRVLLRRVLYASSVPDSVVKPPFPEDELSRGLRMAVATKRLPLWLIFAAQIHLDIHHTLRKDVAAPFREVLDLANSIKASINANTQFHTALSLKDWPESNNVLVEKFLESMEAFVFRARTIRWEQKLGYPARSFEPRMLDTSHPLRCGLLAYGLRVKFQEIGLMYPNAWNSILWTYYLYQALHQHGYLDTVWADLELVIMRQSDAFGTTRLVGFADYYKLFCLSYGVSATYFAKNSRRTKQRPAHSTDRGKLKNLAPVSLMFKERYRWDSARVDLTMQDLQDILSKATPKDQEAHAGDLPDDTTAKKLSQRAKANRPKSQPQPTAIELLERLRDTMTDESMEFAFDYLLLHRVCLRFFIAVHKRCYKLAPEEGVPLKKSSGLPAVVAKVFTVGIHQTKKYKRGGDTFTPESPLLLAVGMMMEECIKMKGDRMCETMQGVEGSLIGDTEDSRRESEADFERKLDAKRLPMDPSMLPTSKDLDLQSPEYSQCSSLMGVDSKKERFVPPVDNSSSNVSCSSLSVRDGSAEELDFSTTFVSADGKWKRSKGLWAYIGEKEHQKDEEGEEDEDADMEPLTTPPRDLSPAVSFSSLSVKNGSHAEEPFDPVFYFDSGVQELKDGEFISVEEKTF